MLLVQCDLTDPLPGLAYGLPFSLRGSVRAAEPVQLEVIKPARSGFGPGPGHHSTHDDAEGTSAEDPHARVGVASHFVPTVSPVGFGQGRFEGSETYIHSAVMADGSAQKV